MKKAVARGIFRNLRILASLSRLSRTFTRENKEKRKMTQRSRPHDCDCPYNGVIAYCDTEALSCNNGVVFVVVFAAAFVVVVFL
jgi:hypothetical protein